MIRTMKLFQMSNVARQARKLVAVFCLFLAGGLFTSAYSDSHSTNPMLKLETSLGSISVELYEDKAPVTVANFLNYVDNGHFDGLIFHRVISGFMVQGGGFDETMKERDTVAPIQNEADNGLKNEVGTLAMARTGDPHSASGQFFINLVDNDFLNHTGKNQQGWGYAVFGKVTEGMDVVEAIGAVATGTVGRYSDVPLEPVVITSATRVAG